jgi:hypothetical protein
VTRAITRRTTPFHNSTWLSRLSIWRWNESSK